MSKIVLDGIVEGISSRLDGTVSIKFATQELDSSKAGELFSLRGKYVKCLISDTNISAPEEILIDEAKIQDGRKIKTKSQKLRAVLYRLHEQTKPDIEFELFYNEYMEKIIEHYRAKLD